MNKFSECSNSNIAKMVYYFQNKDDENKSAYKNTCCGYGLSLLRDTTQDYACSTEELEKYREELMEEAAARYSALFGLYNVK